MTIGIGAFALLCLVLAGACIVGLRARQASRVGAAMLVVVVSWPSAILLALLPFVLASGLALGGFDASTRATFLAMAISETMNDGSLVTCGGSVLSALALLALALRRHHLLTSERASKTAGGAS